MEAANESTCRFICLICFAGWPSRLAVIRARGSSDARGAADLLLKIRGWTDEIFVKDSLFHRLKTASAKITNPKKDELGARSYLLPRREKAEAYSLVSGLLRQPVTHETAWSEVIQAFLRTRPLVIARSITKYFPTNSTEHQTKNTGLFRGEADKCWQWKMDERTNIQTQQQTK